MDALRKNKVISLLRFCDSIMIQQHDNFFWSICGDTMCGIQNEIEPMELDCPRKIYGKVSIHSCTLHMLYTYKHTHTMADELIVLLAEQYRWQQTTNDQ